MNFKRLNNITGWAVFAIATIVYMLTAEPTGSLWDCGEFVSAAHKLEVVHPPGAPLFLMIGRFFSVIAETFTDTESNPANIAYALNMLSGICTAFLVLFIFWTTTILARLAIMKDNKTLPTEMGDILAILGAGTVAGLSTTFATSVWFSAVEGEVYAMSGFFTGLVVWAAMRWYVTHHKYADRWLVFIAYMIGLSIGVHLLSLLVIPFVTLLYFYKKADNPVRKEQKVDIKNNATLWLGIGLVGLGVVRAILGHGASFLGLGALLTGISYFFQNNFRKDKPILGSLLAVGVGVLLLALVQFVVIPKIPALAASFDHTFVNSFGLSVGSGMLFFIVLLLGLLIGGIWYTSKLKNYNLQMAVTSFAMVLVGFSTYGMVVIRANASTPINMNDPSDPYSLLSYLNREQYGERPLFYGPHFAARRLQGSKGVKEKGDILRPVMDAKSGEVKYKKVGERREIVYNKKDYMVFPRLGHMDRGQQYKQWLDVKGRPSMGDNINFMVSYQIGWMYVRYFMWNFVGRQNAKQGFYSGDLKNGHWISGIGFLDNMKVHSQDNMPKRMLEDKGRNTYYFLPLIFGLMGMFFHFGNRSKEAFAVMLLFLMTGLAIIIFLNQPPQEPRERDYAFAGSIFTFCIWIGMAVPAFYHWLKKPLKNGTLAAGLGLVITLSAPLIMGFQNWDDHSRAKHTGARDYAINFLESCAPNAIIFTYGDNDTYPLWYAQEVEGIRTDVRVINFSLLAVDWYIDQLRRKINDSERVKMTIPKAAYRGENRDYLPIAGRVPGLNKIAQNPTAYELLEYIGKDNELQGGIKSFVPSDQFYIPINREEIRTNKAVSESFPDSMIVDRINFQFDQGKQYLMKDEIALLDIIITNAQNGWERPIYFAVTCRPEKIMGFRNYLQIEGMASRIVPILTPSNPQGGVLGMGRVEVDSMYNSIVNKYQWGGFDEHDLFVDESYMPSVHSTQYAMIRLMDALMRQGDNERAVDVLEEFFVAYPDMNFPFEKSRAVLQIFDYANRLDVIDKVKEHIITMATNLADYRDFYESLEYKADLQSFSREIQENTLVIQQLQILVEQSKDQALKDEVTNLLGELQMPQQQGIPVPN